VGDFYADFPELADEDVCRLLKHETEACALTR
jgi:predicted phosphoribosyltransferase